MKSRTRRMHLLIFFAGIIGLVFFLGITEACAQVSKTLIDINTASEKELEEIKGVGPATAKKIIAGRPYKSIDDLKKAKIPDKTIESIKPYVKVGAAPAAAPTAVETKPGVPAKAVSDSKQATPAKPAAPPVAVKEAAKEAPVKAPAEKVKVSTKAPAREKARVPSKLVPGQKININTATKEELEALPEVGPVKAQAIIDGRPYKVPEDVMKVKGIKEGTFSKIKDYIVVK